MKIFCKLTVQYLQQNNIYVCMTTFSELLTDQGFTFIQIVITSRKVRIGTNWYFLLFKWNCSRLVCKIVIESHYVQTFRDFKPLRLINDSSCKLIF